MKTLFNLTTCPEDLDRFQDQADLVQYMTGFDGVELLPMGEDPTGRIPKERVWGLHMRCFYNWLDLWNQDCPALLAEFGNRETYETYYGGTTREALVQRLREDLAWARSYQADYVVFHVADCTIAETFHGRYRHSSEEVIDGACELLNQVFPSKLDSLDHTPWLLLENLWHPGLTFTQPDLTRRLLEGVQYPRTGLLLDTGHLMHMNPDLRSPEQACAYIHQMLDRHGDLCRFLYGVHLHLSLTGNYARSVQADPPPLAPDYWTRSGQLFQHIFRQDQHRPFLCSQVADLIRRIQPRYLVYEFITESRAQQEEYLKAQRQTLSSLYPPVW